ncbi:type IV pilus biogenesis/stability protein PilW [Rhodoferax sp. PAMC 29310]|uniref:type IV pilus biogenesis/stability protein PilW n=1 Tax=Rhodoferax sp. PAMC 29310 TaxID=2822760 RepID=UPI001B32636E|nr:type IV pilus biogenesis/stability protein PilW [Rhodoferax sp. PAMC 29310]
MAINPSGHWNIKRHLLVVGLIAVVGTLMGGCASTSREAGADRPRDEIVTASDETDARKRARIRLELAIGYFEQGQTNIALDELKQSIAADPTYSAGYNMRGLIYMRLNDYRFAEESFKQALALSPRDASVIHNLGWLLCQQSRYPESSAMFLQALANPQYGERAKTYMAHGLCQVRANDLTAAEASLKKSYELDAGNPITAFNMATLLYKRGDFVQSQFYIRRLNNSQLANAESLWLGVKVERQLNNTEALNQLAGQLEKRFSASPETILYHRGAFNE